MTMSRGAGPNNSTATSWNPTDERFGQGAQCPFNERNGCWPSGRRTRDDRGPRWWREREFARRQHHPERQLTRVYSLVNGQGSGWRIASAGRGDSSTVELFPGNCGRIARGCRLGRQGNRGSCRARPRYLAGGGITGGVAQRAPGPPPPRPVPTGLGHPANRSNTLGDDDVSERGPDDIDRDVADPMGNGALGTDPLAF